MANREHGPETQTLQTSNPAPSDALVVFGITGDLAYKKIFPALANLERRGRLPEIVVGVARGGTGRDALIERMRASLAEHGTPADTDVLPRLIARLQIDDLCLISPPLGPSQIHPHQHLCPVLALGTSGAWVNREDSIVLIHFP